MVKSSTVRLVFMGIGMGIMMLILLSSSTATAKGIGIVLSIIFIMIAVMITGPMKSYFQETREGRGMDPNTSIDFR